MTGFRGNLKLKIWNSQGEVYPGGLMKKEYNLTIKYDDNGDGCEIDEYLDEEELIFTIDDKDVLCPEEMAKMLLELDSNILGLA